MPEVRIKAEELAALHELKAYPYEKLGGVIARLIQFFRKHSKEN
jgi:hypothetical protein